MKTSKPAGILNHKDPFKNHRKNTPHSKLPKYTVDEVERGIEVIKILIKVRDRCRREGLISW